MEESDNSASVDNRLRGLRDCCWRPEGGTAPITLSFGGATGGGCARARATAMTESVMRATGGSPNVGLCVAVKTFLISVRQCPTSSGALLSLVHVELARERHQIAPHSAAIDHRLVRRRALVLRLQRRRRLA